MRPGRSWSAQTPPWLTLADPAAAEGAPVSPGGSRPRGHKCPHRRHVEAQLLRIHADRIAKAALPPQNRFHGRPRSRKGHRVPKHEKSKKEKGRTAARCPATCRPDDGPPSATGGPTCDARLTGGATTQERASRRVAACAAESLKPHDRNRRARGPADGTRARSPILRLRHRTNSPGGKPFGCRSKIKKTKSGP
jgi:hypothetical protein